jgi:hypothetical protein
MRPPSVLLLRTAVTVLPRGLAGQTAATRSTATQAAVGRARRSRFALALISLALDGGDTVYLLRRRCNRELRRVEGLLGHDAFADPGACVVAIGIVRGGREW